MFRVVQIHRTSSGRVSKRCWLYKTNDGSRRRIWLCKQTADNIRVYRELIADPSSVPLPRSSFKLFSDAPANSYFLPNSELWEGFLESLKSEGVNNDE